MPYPTNADLPRSVQAHLPEHAQDIYREAFNHAYAAACWRVSAGGGRTPHCLGRREAFIC